MITDKNQVLVRVKDADQSGQGGQVLLMALMGVGILARLIHYLSQRSLWQDEAAVALNIVNRSYGELLARLDYNQAAPPLFLWIEKFAVQGLGNHEYALRLWPLIASIASMVLFYKLVRQFSVGIAMPIALVLFAVSRYPIYYAAEVKPYSTDLVCALLLFLSLVPRRGQFLSWPQQVGLGGVGAVCIWLSYPSVLMLAACELSNGLNVSPKALKALIMNRLPMYGAWLASFAVLYFGVIQTTLGNAELVKSWGDRYPDSLFDIHWLLTAWGRFFYRPLGFANLVDVVAIVAFIIGCLSLYRSHRTKLLLLNLPIAVTLAAAYLHQYPFRERLILYLVPFALVIMAEGMAFVLRQTGTGRWKRVVIGGLLTAALVLPSLVYTGHRMLQPSLYQVHHVRPLLQHIQANWQEGDRLFVADIELPFTYYAQREHLDPRHYQISHLKMPSDQDFWQEAGKPYRQTLESLVGRDRVWFLFGFGSRSSPKPATLLTALDRLGTQQAVLYQQDVMACLYDLRP